MNYINIIEGFWRMNAYDRFSSSEIILYLYLVHICNQNYWKMPIACKTATLQSELGLNKSTIIRARAKLRERGLIDFTEGVQNSSSPNVFLLNICGFDSIEAIFVCAKGAAAPGGAVRCPVVAGKNNKKERR